MALYETLNFDSELFGFPVAKLIPERFTFELLEQTLSELKKQHVRLVYWCSDKNDSVSQQAAQLQNGFLADEKITYFLNLENIKNKLNAIEYDIYDTPEASSDMLMLAFEIGKLSRFFKDKKIGVENCKKVYTHWIHNSCNRSIASDVLVIRNNNSVIGMVTVGMKNQRGDIGLLSVAPAHRGKEIGKKLVRMAQYYFLKKNIFQIQVVTQKDNISACHLYEKCDFKIEAIQHFYHFWLQ